MKVKIANIEDVPEGEGVIVSLEDGREIALFKKEGKIFALDNLCAHMGGPLGEGEIEEGCVVCPWHGWAYDLKSGECSNQPGEGVETYPVVIEKGEVFLDC